MLCRAVHACTGQPVCCPFAVNGCFVTNPAYIHLNLANSRAGICHGARSSRLQQLVPDDPEAAGATVLPVDLGAAGEDELTFKASRRSLLELPSDSPYSSSTLSGGANPPGKVDNVLAAGPSAWTASDDADISEANQILYKSSAARGKKANDPHLFLPVLTALPQPQQQEQLVESNLEFTSRPVAASSAAAARPPVNGVPPAQLMPGKDAWAISATLADAAASASATPAVHAAAASAVVEGGAATGDAMCSTAGSFFSSRAAMLQQLQRQQAQVQRAHVLKQSSQQLYKYTVAAGGSKIRKQPTNAPISPLKQDSFPLALAPQQQVFQQQQQQQQLPAAIRANLTTAINNGSEGELTGATVQLPGEELPTYLTNWDQEEANRPDDDQQWRQQQQQWQQQQQQAPAPPLPSYLQPAHLTAPSPPPHPPMPPTPASHPDQQQQQQEGYNRGTDNGSVTAQSRVPTPLTPRVPPARPTDPSRGLCLAVFLYCCSRTQLLSLTWQLGLAPTALRFVSRVADADAVLHVKPGPGERHYHYEEYRAQAADKGIPFVDLKNLSLLELQLYLLPVFRLYAGELSPRDLLLRKKRRGYKTRYTNIKLPPA